jgi:hypothetical protein
MLVKKLAVLEKAACKAGKAGKTLPSWEAASLIVQPNAVSLQQACTAGPPTVMLRCLVAFVVLAQDGRLPLRISSLSSSKSLPQPLHV